MTNHPLVPHETHMSVAMPVIPLNFIYPDLTLAQILTIIRAYLKLSFLIILAVLSLTALTMTIWPRTYTAMATLMVNYAVNNPLNGKALPVGQVGNYIATQVELMQTPEVLQAVVERLNLTHNERYARGYRGDSGTLIQWVANKLGKNLAIYQGQMGSQLINVAYSANNPYEAAQVANMVAEVYKEQDHSRSSGPSVARAKLYEQQLSDLKDKVDRAQQQVTAFHIRNELIDEGNKTNGDLALLSTLEGRLLEAQNTRRVAEARASEDQSVNDEVLSSTLIQSLKIQLAAEEMHLAQTDATYTSKYPTDLTLQTQITATKRSLASAMHSYSVNASAKLYVARRLEETQQQAVENQRMKVLANSKLNDEAAKYILELESAQSVYKNALEGYDQIMFSSGIQTTNVIFVSRATPPVQTSRPKLLTGYLLGIIAAGILGLGIPLVYELFNRRIRCRDDLERYHGIPVLVEFYTLPTRTIA